MQSNLNVFFSNKGKNSIQEERFNCSQRTSTGCFVSVAIAYCDIAIKNNVVKFCVQVLEIEKHFNQLTSGGQHIT